MTLPNPVTGPTPVPPVPPPSVVLDPPPQEAILIPFSSQSRPVSSSFLSSSRSRPHGHRFFVPVPFDCVPGNLLIRWYDTRHVRAAERVRKPARLLRPAPRFLLRDPAGVDRLDPPGVDGDREGRPDGDRHLLPRRAAVHDQVPLVSVDGPVRSPVPRPAPRVDADDPGGPLPRHRGDGVLRAEGAPRRACAPVVPRRVLQRKPGHRGRRVAHRSPRPGGAGTGGGGAHPRVPR